MPNIYLDFNNSNGTYFFIYLIIPFFLFYKSRINSNRFGLNVYVSNQLKGVFIVVVILHHIFQRMVPGLIETVRPFGYQAVGVFFTLSGYGLVKSLNSKNNYLKGFLQKKFVRVVLPFLVINALTVALITAFDPGRFSQMEAIKYLFSLQLIDITLWFIVTIFIFYCFFSVSFYRGCSAESIAKVLFLVLGYYMICKYGGQKFWKYVSVFCFPLGMVIAHYEGYISRYLSNRYLLILSVSATMFIFARHIGAPKSIQCMLFSIAVLVLFQKISPQSFIFEWFGILSLELYLLHMKILLLFKYLSFLNFGIWVILYLAVLVASAFFLNKVDRFIYRNLAVKFTRA